MSLSGKSNINPEMWGPYFWQTFHFTAFGYPENPNGMDKYVYKIFFMYFMKILPCDKCYISSQKIIDTNLLEKALESRESLIRWSYNFHDKVNKKLNKTSPGFEKFKYDFQNRNSNVIHILIIILLLLMLLYITMRYTSNTL